MTDAKKGSKAVAVGEVKVATSTTREVIGTGVVVSDEMTLANLGLSEHVLAVEEDNYPILSFGGNENLGEENTIYAGQTVVGEFVGTVPMWSFEPKENWKEEEAEGRKYYTSLHYKFLDVNTKKPFGVFGSSTLFNLQKIVTSSTDSVLPNPTVGIKYIGKIEGKDRLKAEFGIELTKGTSAHVCKLLTPPTLKIDVYIAGCINYTRNPLPNFGTKVKMSKIDQARQNFAAIEARKEQRAMESNNQAQLASH